MLLLLAEVEIVTIVHRSLVLVADRTKFVRQDRAALQGCVLIMSAGYEADDSEVWCFNTVDVCASSERLVTLQLRHPMSSEQLHC